MAYTNWSVTFNEQPTAAKWNRLGLNDASFKDGSGILSLAIKKSHLDFNSGLWWEQLGSDTRATAGTTLTVSGFSPKKYLMALVATNSMTNTSLSLRFNNDSTTTYAYRRGVDGTASADTTHVSQTLIDISLNVANTRIQNFYIVNHGPEKLVVGGMTVTNQNNGASNVPRRSEYVAKWVHNDAITSIDVFGAANLGVGSKLVVLGHD